MASTRTREFYGKSNMRTASGRLILRRESDLRRWILAYCVVGLVIIFGRTALAAEDEICAQSYQEIENSKSEPLKAVLKTLEAAKFTNKANWTHFHFNSKPQQRQDGYRVILTSYSTPNDDTSELELDEGVVKFCERNGKVRITVTQGTFDLLLLSEGCFKIDGGFASFIPSDKKTYCPGEKPPNVVTALATKERNREIANHRPANGAAAAQITR